MRPRTLAWIAGLALSSLHAHAASPLRCRVEVPPRVAAGHSVFMRITLTNPGPAPVQMLRWDTPFEGSWLAPFVELRRDGQPLAYQGAVARRAAPGPESYVRIESRGSASAEIELNAAFDVTQPGRYRLQPRLRIADLHVARAGPVERPRAEHRAVDLACPAVEFQVLIPR